MEGQELGVKIRNTEEREIIRGERMWCGKMVMCGESYGKVDTRGRSDEGSSGRSGNMKHKERDNKEGI